MSGVLLFVINTLVAARTCPDIAGHDAMSGHPDMPGHARTWLHVRVQSDEARVGDLFSNANWIEGKLCMLHLPDPFVTDEDNVRCLEV